MTARQTAAENARRIAAAVPDPEMPMLTLADLGVLRSVETDHERVRVTITPTYSGCPALEAIRDDLAARLRDAGYEPQIHTVYSPPWSTDRISEQGRRKLAEHGIAPPGPAPDGTVSLTLEPPASATPCPQCGSTRTAELSRFGATPCTELRRCDACREPFEHVKEL